MTINFYNQSNLYTEKYETLITKVFDSMIEEKVFSIIFVDDPQIQEINQTYRKVDRVTDVISFALCDDSSWSKDNEELGDIFIDLEQALRQASLYGHTPEREVAFLAVHGYLHLCGYDHMTKEDEEVMCKKQEEILLAAGLNRSEGI
ncbi:MAG: rRNA maturation RNase YbeY [Anaeroplasmataceae bacterium]|nr:rRNA maturation RNase YbeY [Anaeroplasmataceae bacterium]